MGERGACGEVACAPPRGCGAVSVVVGRVSGAQARAHRGKRNFGSAVPGTGQKAAERQHGVFDVLMRSMLCNFCSSKAEGHLRLRLALDLGQYRNCLIFPYSIGGYINQLAFCLRGCILLQAPACAAEILSLVWKLQE